MATVNTVSLEEGDMLQAKRTGRTYEVQEVTSNWVYVSGLPRVPRQELMSDIKAGKIKKL